jgi:hypothetical protein
VCSSVAFFRPTVSNLLCTSWQVEVTVNTSGTKLNSLDSLQATLPITISSKLVYNVGRKTRGRTRSTFYYTFILHGDLIKIRYKTNAVNSVPNTFYKTSVEATVRIWTYILSDFIHRWIENVSYKTSQPYRFKWSEYTSRRHSKSSIYTIDASCLNRSEIAATHSRNPCYQSSSLSQFTNIIHSSW